jgi:hypothetical protein
VDWLSIIILLALGISLLLMATAPAYRHYTRVLTVAFSIAAVSRLLADNAWLSAESVFLKVAYIVLLVSVINLLWRLVGSGGDRSASLYRSALVIVVAAGAAGVLTLSGVLIYGQLSGALAAGLTGCVVAGLFRAAGGGDPIWQWTAHGLRGAAGVITLSLVSLVILGKLFADLSTANAILLLGAMAAAVVPFPGQLSQQSFSLQMPARALLCLLPLAAAFANVAV